MVPGKHGTGEGAETSLILICMQQKEGGGRGEEGKGEEKEGEGKRLDLAGL